MCFPWSFEWDVDLFEAYGLVDCGDAPLAIGNVVQTHELIQDRLEAILAAGAIPIAIGGDHSLCIPGARALSRQLGPHRRRATSSSTPTLMPESRSAASSRQTATG